MEVRELEVREEVLGTVMARGAPRERAIRAPEMIKVVEAVRKLMKAALKASLAPPES